MAIGLRDYRRAAVAPPGRTQVSSPASSAPTGAASADASASHRWWILLGLIMAAGLEILDTTVVNVALPQMAGNLGASTDEIAWV